MIGVWKIFVDTNSSTIQRAIDATPKLYRLIASDSASFCKGPHKRWQLLGSFVRNKYNDSLLADSIDWICNYPLNSNALAGLAGLANSIEFYGQSETNEALAAAIDAETRLNSSGSPLANVATIYRAMALYARDQHTESRELLDQIVVLIADDYPFLAARAERYLGSIDSRQRNVDDADTHFRRGIDLLSGGGDPEQLVRLHSLSAESAGFAGRYDEAWREGLDALRIARQLSLSADALSGTCEFLALIAAQSGAPLLQESYADCSIKNLDRNSDAAYVASAHTVRAHARIALRDNSGAESDLVLAMTAAQRIRDAGERENLTHYVNLFSAVSDQSQLSEQSLDHVARAIDYFGRRGLSSYEIAGGTDLAYAYSTLGETEKANTYFDHVGKLAMGSQQEIESAAFSLPIQQHYRNVANRRITARLNANDGFGALRILAETRLARPLPGREMQVLLEKISGSEGEKATLVLAWLEGEVAGWLIDRNGLATWFRSPLPSGRTVVSRAAGTHSTPLPGGRAGALAMLYDVVIAPVRKRYRRHR